MSDITVIYCVISSYSDFEVLSTITEIRGHLVIQELKNDTKSFPHLRNLRIIGSNNTQFYQGKDWGCCVGWLVCVFHGLLEFIDCSHPLIVLYTFLSFKLIAFDHSLNMSKNKVAIFEVSKIGWKIRLFNYPR